MNLRIGCCITPHGFGHAARAAAVLEAVEKRIPAEFVVVTTVPEWFFSDSLSCSFKYHPMTTDIGLVQKNSLQEDLQATLSALDDFYPLSEERIGRAVRLFSGCDLILCDIAPLGLVAAERLGVPSILLENFTWDWIYSSYLEDCPALQPHIEYLQEIYGRATHHLQAIPVCRPVDGLRKIAPISRAGMISGEDIRRKLRVSAEGKLVLLTMGGVEGDEYAVAPLMEAKGYVFVLGGQGDRLESPGNLRYVPKQSEFYHPDLVAAADLVVGKAGYSTLAEVYAAGVPFAYISRETFRESAVLTEFIRLEMGGTELTGVELQTGSWVERLDELTIRQADDGSRENGAAAVARYIAEVLNLR